MTPIKVLLQTCCSTCNISPFMSLKLAASPVYPRAIPLVNKNKMPKTFCKMYIQTVRRRVMFKMSTKTSTLALLSTTRYAV